ncbi:MAG: hypothetical protein OCD01_16605 [Fibrobacterales bacterium]
MKTLLSNTFKAATVGLILVAVGCTKMPSPEDLDKLEQQKSAADAAEQKVVELERQKATLQQELADVQALLAQHEQEFAELKNRK